MNQTISYNDKVTQANRIYYATLLAAKKALPPDKTYDDIANEAYKIFKKSIEAIKAAQANKPLPGQPVLSLLSPCTKYYTKTIDKTRKQA